MSVTYYAVDSEEEPAENGILLGKQSTDFVFQFKWHSYWEEPEKKHYYRNYDEFVGFIDDCVIKDHENTVIPKEEFLDIIESLQGNENVPEGERVRCIDGHYFIEDW